MVRKNKAVLAAMLLTIGTVGVAAPAEARGGAGWAVGAGLLGLGIGAAIASDHPHRAYVDGYYAPPPPPPAYYAPPPPPPAPIGYYAPPPPPPSYGYDYVQHCRVVDRWNPEWGQYQQVRRCW